MRSALAARMYAAVQLSSQQQQMYVENNIKKKEQNEFITYQRFIRKFFFSLSMCIQWPFFPLFCTSEKNYFGGIRWSWGDVWMLITHDDDDDD